MELKYQTLRNLCDRHLKGRKGVTQEAIVSIDKYMSECLKEVLDEACKEADIAKRKLLKGAHVERAIGIIKGRR